jgi:phage tail tape-measure protein
MVVECHAARLALLMTPGGSVAAVGERLFGGGRGGGGGSLSRLVASNKRRRKGASSRQPHVRVRCGQPTVKFDSCLVDSWV